MGPHFFKCGKLKELQSEAGSEYLLQWGRTFSSAESRRIPRQSFLCRRASMGPHFFKCGKHPRTRRQSRRRACFNGAALFQVRKVIICAGILGQHVALQWGRTFSSAERRHLPLQGGGQPPPRFNGAALFQVRKAHDTN